MFISPGRGGGFADTQRRVQIGPGQTLFLRTEMTSYDKEPIAEFVSPDRGLADVEALHLAAGGRARYAMPQPR
jgi:hypothetical protein